MFRQLAGGISVLTLLIGGAVAGEAQAGAQQSASVHRAVSNLFPDARIDRIDPHGRPFLLAQLGGSEVSSAYVDITGPAGRSLLILQRLNRDSGKVDSLLWFSHLSQPTRLEPVITSDGESTASGNTSVQGHPVTVTYSATVTDQVLCVRPSKIVGSGPSEVQDSVPTGWVKALTPAPVPLLNSIDLKVRSVSVHHSELFVELRARDADGGQRAAGPNPSAEANTASAASLTCPAG